MSGVRARTADIHPILNALRRRLRDRPPQSWSKACGGPLPGATISSCGQQCPCSRGPDARIGPPATPPRIPTALPASGRRVVQNFHSCGDRTPSRSDPVPVWDCGTYRRLRTCGASWCRIEGCATCSDIGLHVSLCASRAWPVAVRSGAARCFGRWLQSHAPGAPQSPTSMPTSGHAVGPRPPASSVDSGSSALPRARPALA